MSKTKKQKSGKKAQKKKEIIEHLKRTSTKVFKQKKKAA